ncbi:SDR family NAD(P)-dependent oxidoreductase [Streptomyces sp. NPDC087420]|uniref:SDR family NAD(P)-dependent oxidoreductase n=1 Tax=Streptomyces sp. NPDC087420 TaxID=3365785 RepID=UPI0038391D73
MVNRRVLVVGASSGLGAALAVLHRRAGDEVAAVARRAHRLDELERYGASDGAGRWESVELDLLGEDAVALLRERWNRFRAGRPDGVPSLVYLVAATGDDSDLAALVTLNFRRPVELIRTLAAPGTTIVAISSLAAVVPFPGLAAYCASKAALEAWVTAHREDHDTPLVLVRPGKFDSEFTGAASGLDPGALPWETARRVMTGAGGRSALITLGGRRDRTAARLAPVIGGRRARRLVLPAAPAGRWGRAIRGAWTACSGRRGVLR